MNIPIYQAEIEAGLDGLLKNNSVAYYAEASINNASVNDNVVQKLLASRTENINNTSSASEKNQIDLYYIKSILVSTGWNKNDDVFDPQETWAAKDTPEDKPFNFMHNERDIIGHITSNDVVDFEGNPINDYESCPKEFNILTSAVIYTEWSDPEQKERMQRIVAEIDQGKWFVSMECLFPNFDYALTKSGEQTKVITRNEASAFLTKHLRSYGGDGIYEDYKVGRLLRNLSFSGKGLVSQPANPRSIILEGNDFFDESQTQVLSLSSLKEKNMSDTQIVDLKAQLAESKAANEALKKKVVAEQKTEYEASIQNLEATVAKSNEELAEKTEAIKSLSEANESLLNKTKELEEAAVAMNDKMKEKMEELKEMKKKEAMMKRKAQLEEAGFDAKVATATVEDFNHLDDATFDKIVATMDKQRKSLEKVEANNSIVETPEVSAASSDDEVDSAEASVEILDQVEETSEVAIAEAIGEEDPVDNLRSVATEWLGSVLQSSNK